MARKSKPGTIGGLFPVSKPVIAMIHVGALPGTPASCMTLAELEARAVREAHLLSDSGVHGLMLENTL